MEKKRILILSPHPDDAEYGAWGFLNQNRHEEITVVLVSGVVDRLHEATKAIVELGTNIIGLGEVDGSIKVNPKLIENLDILFSDVDLVLGPFPDDTHSDHREVGIAIKAAARRKKISVLFYATPSTELTFIPNVFVPLTEADRCERSKVLGKHDSQKHQEYFSQVHLETKDRFWAYRIGVEYAEPYYAYKLIL
jgi:LmbE family N-acetylglucosaminyl deacetylase